MEKGRQIVLAFQLPEALPGVLEGISRYVRERHRNWRVLLCVPTQNFRSAFHGRFADGAITGLGPRSGQILSSLLRKQVPVVNVIRNLLPRVPSVISDNHAIGRRAAEYLLERGFRHFGFVGVDLPWSHERYEGFSSRLLESGHTSLAKLQLVLKDYQYTSKVRAVTLLRKWLRKIPTPTAILGAADFIARNVVNACTAEGHVVPEHFAVMGVDDFPSECQIGPVTLTSIAQDFQRIGSEAAAQLDTLILNRNQPFLQPILVPPGKIHVRSSTDVLAFDDPVIVAALRMIIARAPRALTMKELLREIPLSRKWLDHRFKKALGRTPSEEIRRQRLKHVHDLLAESNMPLRQIAARGRFSCLQNMLRSLRRASGPSPHAFRRATRDIPPDPRADLGAQD